MYNRLFAGIASTLPLRLDVRSRFAQRHKQKVGFQRHTWFYTTVTGRVTRHKRRKERGEGGKGRKGDRGLILRAVSHLDTMLSSDLSTPTEKPSFLSLWPWEALFSTLRKTGFSPFNLPRLVPENN